MLASNDALLKTDQECWIRLFLMKFQSSSIRLYDLKEEKIYKNNSNMKWGILKILISNDFLKAIFDFPLFILLKTCSMIRFGVRINSLCCLKFNIFHRKSIHENRIIIYDCLLNKKISYLIQNYMFQTIEHLQMYNNFKTWRLSLSMTSSLQINSTDHQKNLNDFGNNRKILLEIIASFNRAPGLTFPIIIYMH